MRWNQDHSSNDVIDRRGQGGGPGINLGGVLGLLPLLMRSRLGWVAIAVVVGYFAFTQMRSRGNTGNVPAPSANQAGPRTTGASADDTLVRFTGFVLDDAQDTWTRVFAARGSTYRRARLVVFDGTTQTGCGEGDSATGPFYCPLDSQIYLDIGFFRDLSQRFRAGGDFAQAYVVAHEVGHHVQHLLGITRNANQTGPRQGPTSDSVRVELQADCFAGVWASSTQRRNLLEQGDVEEAINAAAAVGDDRIQRQEGGAVSPERWTHGSSAQRAQWFRRGFGAGDINACDTFSAPSL